MQALRPQSPGSRGATAHAGSGSPGSRSSGSSGRGSLDGLLRGDSASSADQEWEPGSYGLVDAPQPKRRWGRPATARPASSSRPALAAAAGSAPAAAQSGRAMPVGGRVGSSPGGGGSGNARILARRAAPVSSPFGGSARRSLDSPAAPTSPTPAGGTFSFASFSAAAASAEPHPTLGTRGASLPGSPRVRSQGEAAALLRLDSPRADRDRDVLGLEQRMDSAAFGRSAGAPFTGAAGARLCTLMHAGRLPSLAWGAVLCS